MKFATFSLKHCIFFATVVIYILQRVWQKMDDIVEITKTTELENNQLKRIAEILYAKIISNIILNFKDNPNNFQKIKDYVLNSLQDEIEYQINTITPQQVENYYAKGKHQAVQTYQIECLRFVAVLDERTSKICRSCDNTVLPIDHSWWIEHMPPMHHRCRSTVVPEDDDYVDSNIAMVKPDVGFGKANPVDNPGYIDNMSNELLAEIRNIFNKKRS